MSKNINKIFAILVTIFSFFSFITPLIKVHAIDQSVVVNHKNGVNIRDKDCKVIGKAGYGETLSIEPGPSYKAMTCNINGKNLILGSYSNFSRDGISGFVALDFVSPIIFGGNIDLSRITKDKNGLEYSKVYLNNTNNLNLRDKKCKISQNVSHEAVLFIPPVGGGAFICQVGNKFYDMTPVTKSTDGSPVYFAAGAFLR